MDSEPLSQGTMLLLKTYLLFGLISHKILWEVLKRRHRSSARTNDPVPPAKRLVKLVKILVLAGIIVQTMLPDILPITQSPALLRLSGVIIFTLGLGIALSARIQLGKNWSDIEDGSILEKHIVVSQGIYRYIKHPIYVGDILLLIGLQLCLNSWLLLGVLLLIPFVASQAIREEMQLVNALPGYAAYAARTKRFIPFVV